MTDNERIVERWLANAAAAGIDVDREELDEILEGGMAARLDWLDQVLETEDWSQVPPDFLREIPRGCTADE